MTLKLFLRDIAGDLARALGPQFRKWTTQIASVELIAVYPILFALAGYISVKLLLSVAFGIAVVKFGAGFISQKRVKTYDPMTHELVPVSRKREAGDE